MESKGKRIADIRAVLENTDITELPAALEAFCKDERTGVQQLCSRYRKRYENYERELARLEQMLSYERKYASRQAVCGIDEAGRGPLAGPVVAAAVILPRGWKPLYLNDSKQLSARRREALYGEIMNGAVSVGVGVVNAERIDEINILQADYEAMRIAVNKLSPAPDILLNDAVRIPGLSMEQIPIIKGDAKSLSIAAASVIAKVTRDRMMEACDELYPEYGFASNKGYGSQAHIEAIRKYGPCPIHRRSFLRSLTEQEQA